MPLKGYDVNPQGCANVPAQVAIDKGGAAFLQSVESANDTWQQLGSHYAGDGAAEILAAVRFIHASVEGTLLSIPELPGFDERPTEGKAVRGRVWAAYP